MTPIMIGTIESVVIDYLNTAHPDYPVYMSGETIPSAQTKYCRFWVIPSNETFPVGMGVTAKSRNVGIVQLDVIGLADIGAGETSNVASSFVKFFSRESYAIPSEDGYLTLKDGVVMDSGKVGESHRGVARIGYRYDFALK